MGDQELLIELLNEIGWERFRSEKRTDHSYYEGTSPILIRIKGMFGNEDKLRYREISIGLQLTDQFSDRIENLNIKQIFSLEFDANRIPHLPDIIGKFSNLKTLSTYNNYLRSLPDSIGNLVNLANISFAHNDLTEIPPSLFKLVKLKRLDLANNIFLELPEDIGYLTNLEELHLEHNLITSLPETLVKLKKLCYLGLSYHNRYLQSNNCLEILEAEKNDLWVHYFGPSSSAKYLLYVRVLINSVTESDLNIAKKILQNLKEIRGEEYVHEPLDKLLETVESRLS